MPPPQWNYKEGLKVNKKNKNKNKKQKKHGHNHMPHMILKPLVLPFKQFYNWATTQYLFSLSFANRIQKLMTYDVYQNLRPHSAVKSFLDLTKCDIFTMNKNKVYEDYLRELRARTLFRRLLYAWRIKRIVQNSKEESEEPLDPITFLPIEKPVYVYDLKQGRRFLFDAQTLILSVRKNLYYQQYGVSQPKRPVNVIMNKPFTQIQMTSIHDQLTRYAVRMEDLGIYRRLEFNVERWKMYMYSHLQMEAYREELYDYQSENGQDMLQDYILDTMDIMNYPYHSSFKKILLKILEWWPDHPILETMRSLCLKSYEADHFHLGVKPLLVLRFKKAIDALWPHSELLDKAYARQNQSVAPNAPVVHVVDEDGDTYMEDMEELND